MLRGPVARLAAVAVVCAAAGAGRVSALDVRQQPFAVRTVTGLEAVDAAAQGKDGVLWFASRGGLVRFDGDRTVTVELGPGERGRVRRVLATRDGAVWAATGVGELLLDDDPVHPLVVQHGAGPGLVRLDPARPLGDRRRVQRLAGLPSPWVWALAEDRRGDLWIGTEAGLVLLSGARRRRFTVADGLPSDFVTALALGPDGALHVATTAGVVVRRRGTFQPTAIGLPALAVAADRAGRLWAATGGRLLRADSAGRVASFPSEPSTPALVLDADDQLWAPGAVYVDGEPVPLADRASLEDWPLLADREGSVWVSSRAGLVRQISTPAVRTFDAQSGLPGRVVYSVLAARDGSVYATSQGGVARYLEGTWTVWGNGALLGGGPRQLAEGWPSTANAGIWSSSAVLARGGPDGLHAVLRARELAPSVELQAIVAARNGDLWAAVGDDEHPRALLRFPGADLRHPQALRVSDGLCDGVLTHGVEARDGSLWFAGIYERPASGLTRIRDGRPRCLGRGDGLPDVAIGTLAEDDEGALWLGTGLGGGLVRFRDGRFATVPASAGLPLTNVTGILDDHRGHLWIGSEAGVWRVGKADLDRCADGACRPLHPTVFGVTEGMRTAECTGRFHPNMAVDGQGNVWVATLAGVSVFAPPERAQRPVVTPIVDQVAIDGVPREGGGPIRIPSRARELFVRYTAASFLGPTRPLLRHRLTGVDPDWVTSPAPATARYDRLAPGVYRLEMTSAAGGGAVTSLDVTVEPPLWRSRLFLAAAAGTLGAVLMAVQRLRSTRRELRLRTVAEERARMARDLHDGLSQKLRAVGLLSERLCRQALTPELVEMHRIIGQAHAELRDAIWSAADGGAGPVRLEPLIEQVLGELEVPPATRVTLATADQSRPVPGPLAREAPLVIKEAVTNALRHAGARAIEVGVLSDGEGLHVWVRDDGRGMVETARDRPGGGYGLISMRERARRVGGVLTIHSTPGVGTEVSLFVAGAHP